MDHDFKARTTSKKYVVRLFYFLFCVLLYNLWNLINVILASWLVKYIPKKLWFLQNILAGCLLRLIQGSRGLEIKLYLKSSYVCLLYTSDAADE